MQQEIEGAKGGREAGLALRADRRFTGSVFPSNSLFLPNFARKAGLHFFWSCSRGERVPAQDLLPSGACAGASPWRSCGAHGNTCRSQKCG